MKTKKIILEIREELEDKYIIYDRLESGCYVYRGNIEGVARYTHNDIDVVTDYLNYKHIGKRKLLNGRYQIKKDV